MGTTLNIQSGAGHFRKPVLFGFLQRDILDLKQPYGVLCVRLRAFVAALLSKS